MGVGEGTGFISVMGGVLGGDWGVGVVGTFLASVMGILLAGVVEVPVMAFLMLAIGSTPTKARATTIPRINRMMTTVSIVCEVRRSW